MQVFPDTLGGSTGLFLPGSSTPATTVGELRELTSRLARMTAAKDKAVAALRQISMHQVDGQQSLAASVALGALAKLEEPSPPCCGKPIEVKKILGGGESWFYAMCECGKILGASHQDDRPGMERLHLIQSSTKKKL